MHTPPHAHLTYCTNIHPGEDWASVLKSLDHTLAVKHRCRPHGPFGIGLRLSGRAASELSEPTALGGFQDWLAEHDCYVFTLNGFPYGGFHGEVVKEHVHAPDWTTRERVTYTTLLFELLAELLPDNLNEGGLSTSPLSYRPWFTTAAKTKQATQTATVNLMEVVLELIRIKQRTGKSLHLDLEPEPDGLLDNSRDLIRFFKEEVLTTGLDWLHRELRTTRAEAEIAIREHLTYCWDVCHVAVAYEEPKDVLQSMQAAGIRIGKLQISAALKATLHHNRTTVRQALEPFNEPVYLHQAVLKTATDELVSFADLAPALAALNDPRYQELRTHFHVPIYTESYGVLQSTNDSIVKTLRLWQKEHFTNHLEVETYTWDVLPDHHQLGLVDSIVREMKWVEKTLAFVAEKMAVEGGGRAARAAG